MLHPSIQILDPRFNSVTNGAGALERLCTGAVWSEGPVWIDEAGVLLWSDIPNNRMLSWHAERGMSVWRDPVEFTNGHVRDLDGALLHCSHGLRAIVRTRLGPDAQGLHDEVLVDRYQGRRLNSPNDIVVKSDGTIWFTDPPYGILSNHEGHQAESELGHCYVFRFDPRDGSLRIVSAFLGSTTIRPGRVNVWGTLVGVAILAIGIAGWAQQRRNRSIKRRIAERQLAT